MIRAGSDDATWAKASVDEHTEGFRRMYRRRRVVEPVIRWHVRCGEAKSRHFGREKTELYHRVLACFTANPVILDARGGQNGLHMALRKSLPPGSSAFSLSASVWHIHRTPET